MKKVSLLMLLFALIISGCSSKYAEYGDGIYADLNTSKGDIVVKLAYDKAPVTVANFISLAEGTNPFVADSLKNKKFYDGTIFHRVIKDFMIQGGDPSGTGMGGPGYKFEDEIVAELTHDKAGIISMANAGPNTNGSQFFITHKETPFLNGRHAVFGEVVSGLNVVDSIATIQTGMNDRPVDSVIINKVEIVREGSAAKKFDAVKVMNEYFEKVNKREKEKEAIAEQLAAEFPSQLSQATETASGLKYIVLEKGNGDKPAEGATVMVDYAGYLMNGTLFDTSWKEVAIKCQAFNEVKDQRGGYQPFPMELGPDMRLIPGFKEGLLLMNYGDKLRLFIPSHLGYGPAGGGPIPPNSDLVFDVKITQE